MIAGAAAGYFATRELPPDPAGRATSSIESRTTRFSFTLPEEETVPHLGQRSLAMTEDGSRLAYVVVEPDGSTRIYQRPLDRLESSILPDTRGAREPFFSPDGKWIGFFAATGGASQLQRLSFDGGVPVVFHQESRPPTGGVSWSGDEIVFAAADGLRRISFNGGVPRIVACGDGAATGELCRWPEMLPGGDAILYTVTVSDEDTTATRIVASSIASGERRTLVEGGSAARFSRTGHLVYAQGGAIFAAPFDVERLRFTLPPTRIADDVLVDPSSGAAQFAISNDGTLAFVARAWGEGHRRLLSLDEGGRPEGASHALPRLRGAFRLSPDGKTVALALEELDAVDIWLYELETRELRRFTEDATGDLPLWSPDGTRLAFRSLRSGRTAFFSKGIEGETPEVLLTDREGLHELASWDDGLILFTLRTSDTGFDVWSLDPETATANPILTSPANETEPASRDGWLAYVSDASGREEVHVIRPDRPGDAIQVSVGRGRTPRWSRDGAMLFYRKDSSLLSVEIGADAGNAIGSPSLVFTMEVDRPFEVRPGGGFLVAEKPAAPPTRIVVVSNFTAELPKAAGTRD
jgi:serine/threonine-protein kinase